MKLFGKPAARKELAAAFILIFAIALGNFALFGQQCQALRADVIRLHILANSDSQVDQAVKLLVRDKILAGTGEAFSKQGGRAAAMGAAREALPEIERIAAETLAENGFDLPVHAEICNMYFNTRTYDDYTLPAGMYDAVRVTLGEGAGRNWWCVIYPPICVPAAQPQDSAVLEEIEALDGQPMLVPKLAVLEAFESLRDAFFS